MRSKRSRIRGTRSKIHIMTGGIKENVSQLEMKGGDLITCLNYQEVDGAYHGYRSIAGYEVMDGTGLASDVEIMYLNDYGNDASTVLLLETQDDYTDASGSGQTVVNTGVMKDTSFYKFFGQSFYFNGSSDLTVSNAADLSFGSDNFTIDFWVRPDQIVTEEVILEKSLSYKVAILANKVVLSLSDDGVSYTDTLTSDDSITLSRYTHVAICRKDDTVFMFLNGSEQSTSLTYSGSIFTNTNDLVIGSGMTGRLDELRFSSGVYRWINDFTVPSTPYSTTGYYASQIDDEDREAKRASIGQVPGQGPVNGVSIYEGDVYGIRNDVGNLAGQMYKATGSGWSSIGAVRADGTYRFEVMRFAELAGYQREPILFFASGKDNPRFTDGSSIYTITGTGSNLLPDDPAADYWCTNVVQFKNRLFLAYPDGRLIFSAVNNPMDYDPLNGAGEFYLEDEITDMIVAPGDALIVFCRNSTHLVRSLSDVQGTSSTTISDYKFSREHYSRRSGAIGRTAQRILGDVYFLDDRGVTNLQASDAFGDFSSNSISKNVQSTLLSKKDSVTCSLLQRESNQYRLFFDDGSGMIFTFDVEKKVKGITFIRFDVTVNCAAEGEDDTGSLMMVFGSDDGYIYRMDSGTSFNGNVINTRLLPAYYSYSTSTIRKFFRKATLEAQAARDLVFEGRPLFDYSKATTPRGSVQELVSTGTGGIWGVSRWGFFTWGSGAIQDPVLYFTGAGKNLSIEIKTSDKYSEPHVINSMTVEYSSGSRVM